MSDGRLGSIITDGKECVKGGGMPPFIEAAVKPRRPLTRTIEVR